MDKDFLNRVLNIIELLGYIALFYFWKAPDEYLCFFGECGYYQKDAEIEDIARGFIPILFFILFLRMCANYIFQLKLSNSIIIFASKKILNKFKKIKF